MSNLNREGPVDCSQTMISQGMPRGSLLSIYNHIYIYIHIYNIYICRVRAFLFSILIFFTTVSHIVIFVHIQTQALTSMFT